MLDEEPISASIAALTQYFLITTACSSSEILPYVLQYDPIDYPLHINVGEHRRGGYADEKNYWIVTPIYTSRFVRGWFEEKGIKILERPPYCPDLDPIEHLWRS